MRSSRLLVSSICTAGLAAAGIVSGGSPALAGTPGETGCPAAYQVLSLTWLAAQGGYRLPFALDAAGNDDGLVCGLPFTAAATAQLCGSPCDVPVLYDFYDNGLTPLH